ncbi:Ig-like domain-containing protein [Providencia rettgeri]
MNTKAGKSNDYIFDINNNKSTAELIFIADKTTAHVSHVALNDSDITTKVADGTNTFVYTVTVVDGKENPVDGITIEGSKDKDGVNITVGSETNAQGQAQLRLTSTKKAVSQIMVSARVGSTPVVNADKTVSFIADSEQAQVVGVTLVDPVSGGSGNTKVANGKNTFTFKAEVKDSLTNGNPVADALVNWSIEPANAAVVFPSMTKTDAQGFAELTLTSTTKATQDITVSASSTVGETKSVGTDDKVSFIADKYNTKPLVVTLIGTEKEKVANGSNAFTFSAKLEDIHGNPVKNQPIVWTKSAGPSLLLPMPTSMTDDMGVSQITLQNLTTTAERNITVTAQYGDLDAVDANEKVSFIADASTAFVSNIALVDGSQTSKIADGKNVFAYTVTVVDGAKNPVSGIQVVADIVEPMGTTLTMNAGEKTGLDGKTVITLNPTTTAVSGIIVQAKAGTSSPLKSTQAVNFIANSETAKIASFELDASEPVEKVANGTNEFTYTVKVIDDKGNPVSGQTVTVDSTLSADLKSRINIQDVSKTNSLGVTTVTLKSTIKAVNDIQLTAKVGRQSPTNANKTVSFIGDETTANITLNAPILTENAGTLLSVTVTTADSNTNPVSTDVTLSSDPAMGMTFYKDANKTPLSGTVTTNNQGKVTIYVTSTVAQKIIVKGTLSSNNFSDTLELTFTSDKNSAYVSSLVAENAPLAEQVAGVDDVNFIATVLDQYGNKVDGVPVTYTTTLGGFGVDYKQKVTVDSDSSGEVKITLKSKLAGIATVTAKTNVDTTAAKTDKVTFIANEKTAEVVEFTADRIIATVKSDVILTALVQDANGNLIVQPHNVTLSVSGLAAAKLGNGEQSITLTTGIDGKVSTTLTSEVSGKVTVLAKTSEKPAGMSVEVTFAPRTDTARVNSISVSPAEAYAGWEQLDVGATLSAEIVDDQGNLVPDSDVTFVVSELATAGLVEDKNQAIVDTPVKTMVAKSNAKGIATIVLKSTKSGSATVKAMTVKSPDVAQSRQVSFTGNPRTATFHSLSATGSSELLVADVDTVTLNAVIWDKNDNPVKNTVVSFTSALGTIKDPARVSTDETGKVSAILESNKAGLIDYNGIIVSSAQTQSGEILFIANNKTAVIQSFTATPSQPVAGGSVPATLMANVVDANGNPLEGINVTFTTDFGSFGGVSAALNQVVSTESNGVAAATLTSNNTGTANLTAKIDNQTAKTTSVEFISGDNTPYVSGLTQASTTPIKVGDRVPFIISTSAKDGSSSKPTGSVSVNLSASAPGTLFYASSTSDEAIELIQTGDNGTANVYVLTTRIGTNQITARSSGTDTNNQVTFTVGENSALSNVVNLDFSPTSAIAGGDDKISVTATVSDTYGNVLTGVDLTFKTTLGIFGNGQTEQSVKTTLAADGKSTASVELSSQQSGQATVTATLSNGKSLTGTATFNTASVASLTKASTSDVVVGTTDTLTAKVVDPQGQALKGVTVTFTATEGNLGGSGKQQITATTQDNGEATVLFTHTKVGQFTVTATTGSDAAGKSVDVTFIADSESAHVTSLSSNAATIAAGKPLALTVTTADQYTNAIGAEVTLSTTNTEVTFYKDIEAQLPLKSNKVTVGTTGTATVYMLSEKAESVTITANSTKETLDTDNSVTFTVIADVDSAKVSTVTLSDLTTTSRLANGVDAFEYKASLVDEYGNAVKVADLNIIWSANNTDVLFKPASTPANTSKTDKDGVATISLTSLVVASDVVVSAQYKTTAKVVSDSKVKFITDAKTAHVSSVTTLDTAATVGDRLAVTVKTTDSTGHPVPYAVSFTSNGDNTVSFYANESGGDAMTTPSVMTDDNGEGTVYVTALHAQTLKVTATTTTITPDENNISGELSFIADSATARVVGITLSQESQTVGKLVSIMINTQDRYTNVVGASVTLSVAEKNKKVIFYSDEEGKNILPNNSVNTNDQGTATVYVTSEVAESVLVSANSSNKEDDKENSKFVTFIADSRTARVNSVTVLPNNQTVGKYVAVNITTVDKFTNSVSTEVTLSSDSENVKFYKDNQGTELAENSIETGDDGKATVYITSLKSGEISVSAISGNSSEDANNSASTTFTADKATAHVIEVSADNSATVGNLAAVNIKTVDGYDNPVSIDVTLSSNPSDTVTFYSDASNNESLLENNTVVIGNDGESVVYVSSSKAQTIKVKATTTTATSDTNNESGDIIFAAGEIDGDKSNFILSNNVIIADQEDISILTLELKDKYENIISGIETKLGFVITRKDGAALNKGVFITDVIETDVKGIYTATLKGKTAGLYIITPKYNGNNIANLASKEIELRPVITVSELTTVKNNFIFGRDEGFPSTGFVGASFRIGLSASNTDYEWSSDASWVEVNNDGIVTFTGTGNGSKVTIIAKPKNGLVSNVITYSFTLSQWAINSGLVKFPWAEAKQYCENNRSFMPTRVQITAGSGIKQKGLLMGEWGHRLFEYENSNFYSTGVSARTTAYWLNDSRGDGQYLNIGLSGGGSNYFDGSMLQSAICLIDF